MIDARGLSCPLPMALVQKAYKNGAPDTIEVLADDPCAQENIIRFANHHGYVVTIEEKGEELHLILKKA